MAIVDAPWSDKQVANLKHRQERNGTYKCPSDGALLEPHTAGMQCPECTYVQTEANYNDVYDVVDYGTKPKPPKKPRKDFQGLQRWKYQRDLKRG